MTRRLAPLMQCGPALRCVYCGDPATMPTAKGPACAECAVELATGQPPPMGSITGKHPPSRLALKQEIET